jgi:replicative DNA helicase
MTISLEKIFFAYILDNKKYFDIVEHFFFKNNEIQFVYNIIRKYILNNTDSKIPSPKQILEMVLLEDNDGLITKEILKSMLTVNLTEYDEHVFILPKFNAWILSNRIKAGTIDIIDETRNLDNINEYDEAVQSANKIKEIVDKMSNTNFIDDDDLGTDFDDAESHVQDSSKYKVRTGIECLDHMLGGGFDVATLSIIMAETSQGKSLWMQNLAIRSADLGYNVVYITLEMSEKKVMKRLGSMRLKIPINDFDRVSKDVDGMKKRIENMKSNASGGDGLFEKKLGKIYTKFWAAGTATTSDFDNYLTKLKDKKDIKVDLVVVDYITLITTPKGSGGDTLYTKGKFLSESLRALASKHSCPVVSAIQVAKDAWGNADLTISDIPESKAIVECCDVFFGLIRTEEMKRQNLYRLKLLKQRDGDFSRSQFRISLNTTYLTLENDVFVDGI